MISLFPFLQYYWFHFLGTRFRNHKKLKTFLTAAYHNQSVRVKEEVREGDCRPAGETV